MIDSTSPPVVLVFAGADPSGGAGIQASIESIASHGCHAVTIVTAITVQDTDNVHGYAPLDAEIIVDQARTILEDMPVSTIQIGMIGSTEAVEAINSILIDYPDIPVILDPILVAGGGTTLAETDVLDAIKHLLLPLTTILTPNTIEAYALAAGADTLDACAFSILEYGCDYILITGTHDNTTNVTNSLYSIENSLVRRFEWERLPHQYHGSGCTLSASIAAIIANGIEPIEAIKQAQEYTWNALSSGHRLGMGQHIPNRFFWANSGYDKN